MTPEEIVAVDAQRNKGGMPYKENLRNLQAMQVMGAQVLREGDTLFSFIPGENLSVEVHTFNAAPMDTFVDNIKKFLRMMKRLGVKTVWTEFDDSKIKGLFDRLKPEFNFTITKGKRYMAKVVLS